MDPIEAYIRQGAIQRGMDPDQAVRVFGGESGLNPNAVGDGGSSFGVAQLHYGGVAPGSNSVSGLGDIFTNQTGLDARNPHTANAQIDFALDYAKQNGWGAWHAWKGDPWAGINAQAPMQAAMQERQQPMPDNNTPVLFGGNPSPIGLLGGLARTLGVGSEDDLGRRLQNGAAGLMAVGTTGLPGGGMGASNFAAIANQPHYNVVTDALGNRYTVDTRTGALGGVNGGPISQNGGAGPNGNGAGGTSRSTALNQSPLAMAAQAKEDAESSAKKMSTLDDAASEAQGLIDMNKLALEYSKNPNTVQGPGLWNMLRDKAAEWTNGSIGGVDLPTQDALEKINSQLVAKMLAAQKGVRFANPEIKFGQTANADVDKPALTNQQIYQNNIQNLQRILDVRNIARSHYAAGLSLNGSEYSKAIEEYQAKHPVYQPDAVAPNRGTQSGRPPLDSIFK